MAIKTWIQKIIGKWLLSDSVKWLNGKRTIIGVIQLALWAVIYGIPAVYPEAGALAEIGKQAEGFLRETGLDLGNEILASGLGFTVIGLVGKILKLIGVHPKPAT